MPFNATLCVENGLLAVPGADALLRALRAAAPTGRRNGERGA
jgi:hypothetical protein